MLIFFMMSVLLKSMNCCLFLMILISAPIHDVICSKEPLFDTFSQCEYLNSTCLLKGIQKGIKLYAARGNEALHIGSIDPLLLQYVRTDRDPNSPFNIELTFFNTSLTGLANLKVTRATIKVIEQSDRLTLNFDIKIPKLWLRGPYEIDGNIFVLPIKGKGDAEVFAGSCVGTMTFYLKWVNRTDSQYGYIDNSHLILEPKRAGYKLSGLFDGNKILAETMDTVVNENALEIFAETSPAIKAAIGKILADIINSFLDHYSRYQLFHQDT